MILIMHLDYVQEWDPPPWHSRMLQMGYPPGYLGMTAELNEDSGSARSVFVLL